MLTEEECARPATRREKRSDGGGLRLVCSPRGGRTWELALRVDGTQKTLALGTWPEMSIAAARAKAEEVRTSPDPMAGSAPVKRAQVEAERARRFDSVAREWFDVRVAPKREPVYAARVWSRVAADLIPTLGSKDVGEITSADMLAVLRKIEERGAIYSAKTVGRYASGIFRFARIAHGVAINPAAGLSDALRPDPPVVRQPALPPEEVPEFFAALDRPHKDSRATRIALALTMHTVLRSRELRGGRWSEVVGADWTVPADRMKVRETHVVPLSTQAAALLAELRDLTGGCPVMFPGLRPGHIMSENTILFCIYALGFKGRASAHGWRATFSTWANASGRWDESLIERCLAHQVGSKVSRAYNRGDYLERRREVMQAWSDWLDEQRLFAALL